MKVVVDENQPVLDVTGIKHLEEIIISAVERAKSEGILSIIQLKNGNDDELQFVVGGSETVLSFHYSHGDPPYYASKGNLDAEEPVLTCYLLFRHHTEFLRKWVIPFSTGMSACHEFHETGNLPGCIVWIEV